MSSKKDVAILLVCTGKYNELFEGFYESVQKHCNDSYTIYVFTDNIDLYAGLSNVIACKVDHDTWPYVVMRKYHYLYDWSLYWLRHEYVVCMQANQRLIRDFNIPDCDLWFCQHPMERDGYLQGALLGGKANRFKDVVANMRERLQVYIDNGTVPTWHDETVLNDYAASLEKDSYTVLPRHLEAVEQWPGTHNDSNIIMLLDKDKFFKCDKSVYADNTNKKKSIVECTLLIEDQVCGSAICLSYVDDYLTLKDVRNINTVFPGRLNDTAYLQRVHKLYNVILQSLKIFNADILILKFNNEVAIIPKSVWRDLKSDPSLDNVYSQFNSFFNSIT